LGFILHCLEQGLLTFGLQPLLLEGKEGKCERAMVFIDYENFEIARQHLYKNDHEDERNYHAPWLDLVRLPKEVVFALSEEYRLVKTFLFAPEPDTFLMQEEWRKKRYDFIKGLGNADYFTVIPGRHIARPIGNRQMIPHQKETYFVDEKGSDINIAVQMITKAFHNTYDTAIVLSGDTDYIPIFDTLNTIGKTVVVVGVKGQNLSRFKQHTDRQFILNMDFLKNCERTAP
jgi:uncharacterized LabA/DUF88 family protein